MKDDKMLRNSLLAVAVMVGSAGFVLVYRFLDPGDFSFFPKCPFYLLTGLECPGCGMQRALHSLLTGDLAGAFHHNALLIPAVAYLLLRAILTLLRHSPLSRPAAAAVSVLYHPNAVYVWLVAVLAYWIVRNVVAL